MVYYTKSRHYNHYLETIMRWLEKGKIIIFLLFIVFGLAYFWQTNSFSTRGFQINALETDIQRLKEENQKLELRAAREQSMLNLEQRVQQLNLVAVGKIEYLRPTGPAVAVR